MLQKKFALPKLQTCLFVLLGMCSICGLDVQSADALPAIPPAPPASAPAPAAAGDNYKIKLSDWSYGRERKTVTGINRVSGEITAKNSSTMPLHDVTFSLNYFSGLGEKVVEKATVQNVATLKPGEFKKVILMAEFIPIFHAYAITVKYTDEQKNEVIEEWRASSDLANPEPIPTALIKGAANVVILGQEASLDKTGKYSGTLRVKNEGTEEAKKLKITVTYFDAKHKKLGDWSGPLGTASMKSGEEAKIPFVAATRPHVFESCEVQVSCEDPTAEAALNGGEFSTAAEVEFAHFQFKRVDSKTLGMKVTAKVRNGCAQPVDQANLTLVFYGPKKKELKRYVYEHPLQLKAGEIQPLEFIIAELPAYETYEQTVSYCKLGSVPVMAATKETPPYELPVFKKTDEVEVLFIMVEIKVDKSVSLLGALRNGKSFAVKDILITVTFEMPDGSKHDVEKTLPDLVLPNEERNFPVKAAEMAGYKKYSYTFKFNQAEIATEDKK